MTLHRLRDATLTRPQTRQSLGVAQLVSISQRLRLQLEQDAASPVQGRC